MTRRPRWNHCPAFMPKAALVAIKGETTLAEFARQFDVHPNLITPWRSQFLEEPRASSVRPLLPDRLWPWGPRMRGSAS